MAMYGTPQARPGLNGQMQPPGMENYLGPMGMRNYMSAVRGQLGQNPGMFGGPGMYGSGNPYQQAAAGRFPQPAPRTGMGYQPPQMPAGRMPVNGMAPMGGRLGAGGAGGGMIGGAGPAPSPWGDFGRDVIEKLPQGDLERWNAFNQSLYTGPDFKGRHEMAQMLASQYARLFDRLNHQPAIDYSGSSEVADQFANQRERLLNQLAARGVSGAGVEAGALANSYGSQARAMGSFYRDAQERRRQERLAQEIAFENWARQLMGQGLERNYAEQDDPGFWGDVAGVVGGVAGKALGGIF